MTETLSASVGNDEAFVCDCEEWQREACVGEGFFAQFGDKRYCILHSPTTVKDQRQFDVAVMRKLGQNDFNFRGVYFPADFNLTQFVFTSEAVFSEATFAGGANFESTQFCKLAWFVETRFNSTASFLYARFDKEAEFFRADFGTEAYFTQARFGGKAAFSAASFAADAVFSGAIFNAEASFNSSTFGAYALFSSTEFKSVAFFEAAEFNASIDFYSCTFQSDANFTRSVFHGRALFDKSRFQSQAHFGGCQFKAEARFKEARFGGPARFYETSFNAAEFTLVWFDQEASFMGANFDAEAIFHTATFNAHADFVSVPFKGLASFILAHFEKSTHFTNAVFRDYVCFTGSDSRPVFAEEASLDFQFVHVEKAERLSFHTATLRPHWFVNADPRKFELIDLTWRNDLNWSGTYSPKDELKSLTGKVVSPHRLLSITYRQLAVNAEENHRYIEASRFRYASMESRRLEKLGGFVPWRLDWWYWLASGYGESSVRAFSIFVVLIVLFSFGYTRVDFEHSSKPVAAASSAVSPSATIEPNVKRLDWKESLAYSLNVSILQKPEPKPFSFLAELLVWLETVLGPAQAALLALAVRRRFMR
jgi:hypothetical protein